MKRFAFVILAVPFFTCHKHPQTPVDSSTEFNIVYSTTALEQANAAAQSSDGGYVLAGTIQKTGSSGKTDAWVLKIDKQGKTVWQRSFGGSDYDCANAIASTRNGGYIIAGYTSSNDGDIVGNHGNSDAWVIKLDKNGNKEWQKTLGGAASDMAASIIETSDGTFVMAGQTQSTDGDVNNNHGKIDAWLVKLDMSGNKLWQKTLGGSNSEGANCIMEDSGGDYLMAGWTTSNDGDVTGYHVGWGMWVGNVDGWVVRLNKDGNLLWNKAFGGVNTDMIYSIVQGIDKSYTMVGLTRSSLDGDVSLNHGGQDVWLFNMDKDGKILWRKNFGGSGEDMAYFITSLREGAYMLAGLTSSEDGDITGNHGGEDAWLLKVDGGGNKQWQRVLGGSGNDLARVVMQRSDGTYLMVGSSGSSDGDVKALGGAWVITVKEQ